MFYCRDYRQADKPPYKPYSRTKNFAPPPSGGLKKKNALARLLVVWYKKKKEGKKHTDEVAVRTTTQAAAGMIHLMAVGIWIWGSSFLFPPALIPVNSG